VGSGGREGGVGLKRNKPLTGGVRVQEGIKEENWLEVRRYMRVGLDIEAE
jgi:hypothetical protein